MYQIGEIMLNICDYTIQDHSRSPTWFQWKARMWLSMCQ